MAFCGDPVAPPKLGQPVPKEYVRQQVRKLGIRNVSEEDLEHYAAGKIFFYNAERIAFMAKIL